MIKIINFREKIYGNMATVFHRTSYSNLINSIYTEGFKPGSGAMYGKGFYSTYDIASQERDNMADTYGSIVIKFAVPIDNFFIFDWEEFQKVRLSKELKSTKKSFLKDQIEYYDLNLKKRFNMRKVSQEEYTSDTALWFYKYSDLYEKVKGIIFTGSRDGKVLVSYDTKIIIPLAYKVDGEKDFSPIERNKEYMKQVLMKKLVPFDSVERSKLFDWVKNADTVEAEYSMDDEVLIWSGGIWKAGSWKNGIWEKGFWEGGTWEGGTWKGGLWTDGIWERGKWEDGLWIDGIWKGGTWIHGSWEDGKWETGIWKDGKWFDGVWKDGFWEDGLWAGGTWMNGWIYDPKKKGNFRPEWKWTNSGFVESPISPKKYWKGVKK